MALNSRSRAFSDRELSEYLHRDVFSDISNCDSDNEESIHSLSKGNGTLVDETVENEFENVESGCVGDRLFIKTIINTT